MPDRGDRREAPGYGAPENFLAVLRQVWFAPGRFFKTLDPEGGLVRPALFAATVLFLDLILNSLLQMIGSQEFNYSFLYASAVGLVVALVLGPLLVAGFTALVLFILDGTPSRELFGPLFRALGYATGIGVVLWIPYAPLVALPYFAGVATVAVKQTLGLGWRRAALGALLPLLALGLILLLLTGPAEAWTILINRPET